MLSLIKTSGGSNGSPQKCSRCGLSNFIRTGHAWHCGNCGIYVPRELGTGLQDNLNKLNVLHQKLKSALAELEELVK